MVEGLLVGLRQIGQELKRGSYTVRMWIKNDGLPAFRVGGKGPWVLLRDDLLQWLAEQKRAGNSGLRSRRS
jgi:hypothetical protein